MKLIKSLILLTIFTGCSKTDQKPETPKEIPAEISVIQLAPGSDSVVVFKVVR